jgi:hypothetical protein
MALGKKGFDRSTRSAYKARSRGPPVLKPGVLYGAFFDIVKRKGYAGGGVFNYRRTQAYQPISMRLCKAQTST